MDRRENGSGMGIFARGLGFTPHETAAIDAAAIVSRDVAKMQAPDKPVKVVVAKIPERPSINPNATVYKRPTVR